MSAGATAEVELGDPPQIVSFGDDLGMQTSLPIHPDKWRRYLKPCYMQLYQPFRQAGHYVYMHTDGHIAEIIGAGSIIIGFAFGLIQVGHIRNQQGVAPMDLVMDLAGGIVSVMCRKLRRWQDDLREEQQQPSWGEWFEWLGDQALALKQNVEPAHIRHRHWKP